jgi:hypothetical protein
MLVAGFDGRISRPRYLQANPMTSLRATKPPRRYRHSFLVQAEGRKTIKNEISNLRDILASPPAPRQLVDRAQAGLL